MTNISANSLNLRPLPRGELACPLSAIQGIPAEVLREFRWVEIVPMSNSYCHTWKRLEPYNEGRGRGVHLDGRQAACVMIRRLGVTRSGEYAWSRVETRCYCAEHFPAVWLRAFASVARALLGKWM